MPTRDERQKTKDILARRMTFRRSLEWNIRVTSFILRMGFVKPPFSLYSRFWDSRPFFINTRSKEICESC